MNIRICTFQGSHEIARQLVPMVGQSGSQEVSIAAARCRVTYRHDAEDLFLSLVVLEGRAENISLELEIPFNNWDQGRYVLVPGALYNGNRMAVQDCEYPPIRLDRQNFGPSTAPVITDVPRLGHGSDRFCFHAGDAASPAMGIFDPATQSGFLMLTTQLSGPYETGFGLEENLAARTALLHVAVPGVNRDTKYSFCETPSRITTRHPSPDRGADLVMGESLELRVRLHPFPCSSVQQLFDVLFTHRKALTPADDYIPRLPFQAAADLLEEKFNLVDWVETPGYYSMGPRPGVPQAWILGWPGMMMYPMLLTGSDKTRQRALRNIDFIVTHTQAPTGFYYGSASAQACFGDNFRDRNEKNFNLIRRNADGLYYLVRCLILLAQDASYDSSALRKSVAACAQAFVNLWQRYGQIGQFVDVDSGEILVGGTSSGALCVGALALCGSFFQRPDWTAAAGEIAKYYRETSVALGVTNGGPGEIHQAPDSESAYALVESYVTLYEVTGDVQWLTAAGDATRQFATWCMPYNYGFPKTSEFHRLGMNSIGSVFANVQNKHSAPGICTHSGQGLLRLARYTGERQYFELIREVAGSIPQYLSTRDRPIHSHDKAVKIPGEMHERVSTCDWEGASRIGEAGRGNCWCSVSLMMTCAEIPGLYFQPDTGLLVVIDHVVVDVQSTPQGTVLRISNPTVHDAVVSVLVETSTEAAKPGTQELTSRFQRVTCPAGKTIEWPVHHVKEGK